MARMSIYVTDELKVRMDERPTENWSGIAQRAFELQLNSTLKGGDDMTAVIERLRASKAKIEEQERPKWTQEGRDWASDDADYDELARVAEINADEIQDGALLQALTGAIYDDPTPDRDQMTEICERLTGDDHKQPTPKQLTWFIEGAQEVWEEVEDKI